MSQEMMVAALRTDVNASVAKTDYVAAALGALDTKFDTKIAALQLDIDDKLVAYQRSVDANSCRQVGVSVVVQCAESVQQESGVAAGPELKLLVQVDRNIIDR